MAKPTAPRPAAGKVLPIRANAMSASAWLGLDHQLCFALYSSSLP